MLSVLQTASAKLHRRQLVLRCFKRVCFDILSNLYFLHGILHKLVLKIHFLPFIFKASGSRVLCFLVAEMIGFAMSQFCFIVCSFFFLNQEL